jgi:prepilin-type processing-associated H-X9-DG protein
MVDNPTPPPVPDAAPVKFSGMAIASLVLGILGCTSLLGLALGIAALARIRSSNGKLTGSGVAVAGIIVSAVFLLLLPVAMLLPVLAAAKQRAQMINSISNEKQLALAVRIYADSNTNCLPPAAAWCDAIEPNITPNVYKRPGADPASRCGYAFNAALSGRDETKVNPDTVMIFESDAGWNANGGSELMITPGSPGHSRLTAVAFADGHVEEISQYRLNTLR